MLGEIKPIDPKLNEKLHEALKTRRLQLGNLESYTTEQIIHMDITILSMMEEILLMIDNHTNYLKDVKEEIEKLKN